MSEDSTVYLPPPWIAAQTEVLLAQRGHAWLLQGPSGLGHMDLALALARAWLCERSTAQGACGTCASCHAIDVHTHADLCVLMPESAMLAWGWPLGEKAQDDIDAKKRKPSREIRIDAMRDALEFTQRTSARGHGQVVVVYPAERMNVYTANALLKTLEEPPGNVRFVLATESSHQLLPTIRSRCQHHVLTWPEPAQAMAWLLGQGMPQSDARIMLQAAGGRPQEAMAFSDLARIWSRIPKAVAQGDVAVFKDCTPVQTIDVLQKICHDLLLVHAGASPRFFDAGDLPSGASWSSLGAWSKALSASQRTSEHPFNVGLMQEALVSQAQIALNSGS